MRVRLALLVSIAALAGFGLHAGGAGAVTFGADLNAAADNTATCSTVVYFQPQPSCTVFSSLPGPTFYAPASGTVTAVRVKTGNSTQGPMQVIVMRSLYKNKATDPGHPDFACCFVREYGPTFTPDAGGITTVSTSLSVTEDATPAADDYATSQRADFLALSVLAADVPVPANVDYVSAYSPIGPAPNTETYPAPSSNPIIVGAGFPPFMYLMMNADLDTSGGGGTNPVPQGDPLKFPSGGSLLGTTASIPLECVLTSACDGVLKLANQATAAATAAKKKTKTYGSKKFSIPAGKTKNVKVKLNAAGRKKLGTRKTLTVTANAKVGSQTVSSKMKLKRHKKK